ncbi:MAG: glycosyltransferase [Bauldia sp.]
MILAALGYAFIAFSSFAQLLTVAIVAGRVTKRVRRKAVAHAPKVSLLRPVRGIENFIEEEIETSFQLAYPNLEIILCVDEESDPIVPIVRRLIARYPEAGARLLVGRDTVSGNPKVNNLWKGWQAATADWIILSDSNALLPRDYVECLFDRWAKGVGVVSHATIAVRPEGFVADLECALMNSYQARWALAGDSLGRHYALGKTLMWRRDTVEAAGGYRLLGEEAAEDISSTLALRRVGLVPRLALKPLPQAIGRRRLGDVWQRQLRWAQVRRSGLPGVYAAEPIGAVATTAVVAILLGATGSFPWWVLPVLLAVWYGSELALIRIAGWPLSWRTPVAFVVRDVLVPAIWLAGWTGRQLDWRGNTVSLARRRKRAAE